MPKVITLNQKRQRQQNSILFAQAELQQLADDDRNERNRRDRQADRRKDRTQRKIEARLQTVGLGRPARRQALWKQDHRGDDNLMTRSTGMVPSARTP